MTNRTIIVAGENRVIDASLGNHQMETVLQGPDEHKDWEIDWSRKLGEDALGDPLDTIAASSWSIEGPATAPALEVSASPAASFSSTTTLAFFRNGVLGESYVIHNQVTTAAGREYTRSFKMLIQKP